MPKPILPYNRFIKSNVLQGVIRPSGRNSSLTTVTGAINSLFDRYFIPENIENYTEWNKEDYDNLKITNELIIIGLERVCKKLKLKTKAYTYLEKVDTSDESIENCWRKLKQKISDPDSVLIYHRNNGYCILAGYYEEPRTYDVLKEKRRSYYDRRDWLVIAEHSTETKREGKTIKLKPIEFLSWQDFQKDLNEIKYHCLICLQRIQP